jgi:isopropylmalate/homocitrate/citramalate synthase
MDSCDDESKKIIYAITIFKRLGAKKLKVSIDNIFINGVTSMRYLKICQQISVAESYGVKFIRINDTLGWLQPAETLTLCSTLVRHYPRIIFSLSTHNDRGLSLKQHHDVATIGVSNTRRIIGYRQQHA